MTHTVVQVITELRPGGAERVVHDLAQGLPRKCFTPAVAALDGRGEYAARIRELGVEVHDLGAYHRYAFGAIGRLRRFLQERRASLVHTHLLHATVVGRLAARALVLPTVATSHIVDRRPVGWHFLLDRWTVRWCSGLACVSEAVRRFHQARTRLPSELYRVIPNGIALDRFASLPERAEARERLGLPSAARIVGGLGRWDRQKGFDVFIQAAAQCEAKGVVFALAGYGPEEAELRRQARDVGLGDRFRFLGYQPAAEAFLPALDIVVVPSRWEGFGLVVLEAMACGLPLIASRVDSIPEIARHGQEAVLVAPEAPGALAKAIRDLVLDEPRQRALGQCGRVRAQAFSQPAMVQAYVSLYEDVLQGRDAQA